MEYTIADDVQTETVVDNLAVRLSGNVYVLEGTAVDIWKYASGHEPFTPEGVCAAMSRTYGTTAEEINEEVDEFLSRLLQWQLIRVAQR